MSKATLRTTDLSEATAISLSEITALGKRAEALAAELREARHRLDACGMPDWSPTPKAGEVFNALALAALDINEILLTRLELPRHPQRDTNEGRATDKPKSPALAGVTDITDGGPEGCH